MNQGTRSPTKRSPEDGRLTIGIDGTPLLVERGYGRVLAELLPELLDGSDGHRYRLFADRHTAARLPELPPVEIIRPATSRAQSEAASAEGGRRGLADLAAMGRAVARAGLDCMLFPTVYSWYPVLARVPQVVGFLDTIAERHADLVFPDRASRWAWACKSWTARRSARVVVTISEYSKRSLVRDLGVDPERIVVTPLAPPRAFAGPPPDAAPRARSWLGERGLPVDAPFLIYVGGFNPHKNLGTLLLALERLRDAGSLEDLWLLAVGPVAGDLFHGEGEAIRRRVEETGLEGRVVFPGFVPDAELAPLYAQALASVTPSLQEGFGLPAVEAAACGTPAIATRESPLPEVLEGGGLFFDPRSVEELASAVARLSGDPGLRLRLACEARRRASALSWSATARATRGALERAALPRGRGVT